MNRDYVIARLNTALSAFCSDEQGMLNESMPIAELVESKLDFELLGNMMENIFYYSPGPQLKRIYTEGTVGDLIEEIASHCRIITSAGAPMNSFP